MLLSGFMIFNLAFQQTLKRVKNMNDYVMLFFFKYLPPIFTNLWIVLYQNQIFIKHYKEDVYHIVLNIRHYCPISVQLRRHKSWQIPAIFQTILNMEILSFTFHILSLIVKRSRMLKFHYYTSFCSYNYTYHS